MTRKTVKKTNKTILLVVEGDTEDVFVKHLKSVYVSRDSNFRVNIKNARGYGPQGVADKMKSTIKTAPHDLYGVVMDSDIEIDDASKNYFKEKSAKLFLSSPVIEATLLQIKGKKPKLTNSACKEQLDRLLPGDKTDPRYYERNFDAALIEKGRSKIESLDKLITFMTTGK